MKHKLDDTLSDKARAAFDAASRAQRQSALKHATEFMDILPFKGTPATETQSLAWPRKGVYRDDGAPIVDVPKEIKRATAMVAGLILAKVPFDAPAVTWVFREIGHLVRDDAEIYGSSPHATWH
jgi:hypothetical protein